MPIFPKAFSKSVFLTLIFFALRAELPAVDLVKVNGEVLKGSIEVLHVGESVLLRLDADHLIEIAWNEIRSIDGKAIHAASSPAPPASVSGNPSFRPRRPFSDKSWYLNILELGIHGGSYPDTMEAKLNELGALPGASTGRTSVNLLGVYWPVGRSRQWLLGGINDSTFTMVSQGSARWSLERDLYAFSAMYFPFGKIGDHLFFRSDAGLVRAYFVGSGLGEGDRGLGAGLRLGVGYAIPMGRFVRPLLNFGYVFHNIVYGDARMDLGTYQGISFDVGLLW